MFYDLTIENIGKFQTWNKTSVAFRHYENAYAFQSRRMNDLLAANLSWRIAEDHETKDFDAGSYLRTVILADERGMRTASLTLTNRYFGDALVEQDSDR